MQRVQLIGFPQSTYVRVCRIVAEEKNIAYDLVPVRPHTPAVTALHPFGKVPVLRHGDLELCESRAIVGYLDAVFPGPRLIPEDPIAAARVEQWVSLVNTTIDPVLVRKYLFAHWFPKTPGQGPDPETIARLMPTVERHLALIAAAVAENGHFVGDGFSYADANVIPILDALTSVPESAALIEASGALKAFMAKHATRPSVAGTAPGAA